MDELDGGKEIQGLSKKEEADVQVGTGLDRKG